MFEVGKNYEFRMIEGGDEVMFWGQVETYDPPLIKLFDVNINLNISQTSVQKSQLISGRIINVSSPNFISAVKKLTP